MTNSTVSDVRSGDRVFEEARKYGAYPWLRQDFFRSLLVQDVQILKILEAHQKDERAKLLGNSFSVKLRQLDWKISVVWARAYRTLEFMDSLPVDELANPAGEAQ